MILLDTNAVVWLDQGHRRTRALTREGRRLYVSPATLLELQILHEVNRIRLRGGVQGLMDDGRWVLDEPPAGSWFQRAAELIWTHDPFDRLIAAHAQLRRWRLATSDAALLDQLGPDGGLEL